MFHSGTEVKHEKNNIMDKRTIAAVRKDVSCTSRTPANSLGNREGSQVISGTSADNHTPVKEKSASTMQPERKTTVIPPRVLFDKPRTKDSIKPASQGVEVERFSPSTSSQSDSGSAVSEAKRVGYGNSDRKQASRTLSDRVASSTARLGALRSKDGSPGVLKDKSRISHHPEFGYNAEKGKAFPGTRTTAPLAWGAPLRNSKPEALAPKRDLAQDKRVDEPDKHVTTEPPRPGNPGVGREAISAKTVGRENTASPPPAAPEKRQPTASAGIHDKDVTLSGSRDKSGSVPESGLSVRRTTDSARSEAGKDKPQQSVSPLRHGAELSVLTQDLKTKHKFSLAFDQQNQVAATGRYLELFDLTGGWLCC